MDIGNRTEEFIKNPKRALFTLAIPVIIATAVETAYGLVDTAYVGRLGENAIAALAFSFPVFFGLIALEAIADTGMQSKIARFLGEKNKEAAENTAMHGIIMAIIIAALLLPLFFSLRLIFMLLGANGIVLELALSYMRIILLGSLLMFPAYTIGGIFVAQGNTKIPMVVDISSLLVNAILAPFFIYYLKLGVRGSALATVCALVLALTLGIYFLGKRSYLKLSWRKFRPSIEIAKSILKVGIPTSFMIAILSLYVVFITRYMAHFGTPYVAAFGISSRLEGLAIIPVFGFGSAMVTLAGMFYGAKRYDLLKKMSYYGLKIATAFTMGIGILFFGASEYLYRLFTPDRNLIALGSNYMRIDVLTFPLMAVNMIISRILQGMGFGTPGFIINVIRIFGVALPLGYIFVYVLGYGYLSVAVAMVLGGISSDIVALILFRIRLKKILQEA